MLIVHRKCGFINRNLFQLWAERVLFPAIERRCVEYDYEGDAVITPMSVQATTPTGFLKKPSRDS
jgi:hypothetical protein